MHEILSVNLHGKPPDHGGVFFYGIHQVDAMVELLGPSAKWVHLLSHGNGGIAVITYRDGPIRKLMQLKTAPPDLETWRSRAVRPFWKL